jgi:flagellar export protein FliJ
MAFHFSLDSVLRLRQSLEDQEKQRLETLLSRQKGLLDEIERSRDADFEMRLKMQLQLIQGGLSAGEVQLQTFFLHARERHRQFLQIEVHKLQKDIAHQISAYQQERRRREVLESVRDRQLEIFQSEQQRKNQAQIDELHLLRRIRERTGPDFA